MSEMVETYGRFSHISISMDDCTGSAIADCTSSIGVLLFKCLATPVFKKKRKIVDTSASCKIWRDVIKYRYGNRTTHEILLFIALC